MIHCNQFPRFMQAKNYLPLHDWSNSIDGLKTYHCLLEIIRGALVSDELMLCLSTLVTFHSIMSSIKSDDMGSYSCF